MIENNTIEYLEEFLKNRTGLPFVELSVERVFDNNYHKNKPSSHDHYEILYVQKGKASFDIEGEKIELLKKDFLIIKPHKHHRLIIDSDEPCSFITLYFNFKKQDDAPMYLESLIENTNNEYGAILRLNSLYKNQIVNTLNKITWEMNNDYSDSEFLCSLMITEILVWISRAMKNKWEKTVNRNKNQLREIMAVSKEYIDKNYNKEIGLNDIANNVYLSPSHFARVFKNYYNISPIQYMLSVRIKKAKELLTETDMKIADISFEVGFLAQQRFNDIFKKSENMSPSEFRKKNSK